MLGIYRAGTDEGNATFETGRGRRLAVLEGAVPHVVAGLQVLCFAVRELMSGGGGRGTLLPTPYFLYTD
ncbi:hypothetical protein [Streptomyces goshikiensis]|uniref:hypothetical protein n=1 Tax=Streptomyces goshikiensis TaxID=1942 RepID=UPI0033E507FF